MVGTYEPNRLRWALREARLRAGLTQNAANEALAALGFKRAYNFVWRVEAGREIDEPKFVDVAGLAAVYGKPLCELAAEAGLPTAGGAVVATADRGVSLVLDPQTAALARALMARDEARRAAVVSGVLMMLAAEPEDREPPT